MPSTSCKQLHLPLLNGTTLPGLPCDLKHGTQVKCLAGNCTQGLLNTRCVPGPSGPPERGTGNLGFPCHCPRGDPMSARPRAGFCGGGGGGTGRACALGPNGLAFLQGHLLWGLASPLTAPPTPSHSAAQASSTATNGRRLTRSSHSPLSARPDTCPPPLAAEPAAPTPSRAREKLTDQRHPRNQASIFSTVKILPPLSDPISGHTSWRGDGHQQGDKALPWERQAGRSWAPHSSRG